jgi:hypothetical protein
MTPFPADWEFVIPDPSETCCQTSSQPDGYANANELRVSLPVAVPVYFFVPTRLFIDVKS